MTSRSALAASALAFLCSPALAEPVPAKAEIVYEGTHSATVARRQRQPTRIDLGRMLAQAMSNGGQRYEGAITIRMRFDGAAAYADVSGTGGLNSEKLSGLVQGERCRLTDAKGLEVFEGICSRQRFVGTIKSTASNRMVVDGRFDAAATSFTDVGARDSLRAQEQAVADARAAEKKRINDARRARLKPLCDAGKVSACVEMDTLQ
jgi:hypothetical protein